MHSTLTHCVSSDVDECETKEADCAHSCHNTLGSYACVCNAAYELGSDGKQCYSQFESPPGRCCTSKTSSWADGTYFITHTFCSFCQLKESRWRSWTAVRPTMADVRTTATIQPAGLFAAVTMVTGWTTTSKPVLVRGSDTLTLSNKQYVGRKPHTASASVLE